MNLDDIYPEPKDEPKIVGWFEAVTQRRIKNRE
jgi:hypothetical protein